MLHHTAEIVAVGTELLLGSIANTNAQYLSQELNALGIGVCYHTVVGDNPERLRKVLAIARERADIVITTGGLGPTYDDLTKTVVAESFGRKLVYHPEIEAVIRRFFETSMHVPMTENNLQQAWLPENCAVLPNAAGTAPGCAFEEGGVHVLMLPGPPHELECVFEREAKKYIQALSQEVIRFHDIRSFGLGESAVEDLLRAQMERMVNPSLATYAKPSEVRLRATARAATEAEAEAMLAPVVAEVRAVLGDYVYGVDVESLPAACLALLKERGQTFATAESCTGGLIAERITSVSGSSEVFGYGFVTYWEQAKAKLVGVEPEVIARYNVVSAPVAAQMALGAAEAAGADIAVSVTGVAGPTGGDELRPVGTVYVGAARGGTAYVKKLFVSRPDRAWVRGRAAQTALELALRLAQGKLPDGTKPLAAARQHDAAALDALDKAFLNK